MTSFYVPDGDAFVATGLTRGPWSNDHQHGGPPAALLARAFERFDDDAGAFFLARMWIELHKPVPIGRVRVRVEADKRGKRVDRLRATLAVNDDVVMTASALRMKRQALAIDVRPVPLAVPLPSACAPFALSFFQHDEGYHRGVEVRFARGTWGDDPCFAWMRPVVPLVAGETASPLQRVCIVVDAESGVCPPVDVRAHTFLNPDLTVMLDREPTGDWVGLDVVSTASPLGAGLARSALYDEHGLVGLGAQTLLLATR